ncbi:hypothetical protein K3555_03545 [Leisingera sp. M527]|uniref:hypothetical protein n=1 Tax=unclassified Leisingera TaxID=2614906 RepID=UPI0021A42E80|nr:MULTISPECIES: hypothetical protein [unclassified Leisingera]UWQ27959.1 hypothetical protein K3557_14400 [Leisingera sp. M523]UWQ33604.1 hypothetical protein K3555_03545 [Leisingera sp. M527]
MKTYLFSAAVAATALFSNSTDVQADEILLEGHRPKLALHSDLRLRGDVKKRFAYFRKNADYYGALYVNSQEDISGEFWDTRNLALAKQSALESCRLKSENPSHCALYATVGPKKPSSGEGIRLSQTGNRLFKEYQRRQKDGKFGAFATTKYGHPGYSRNLSSEVEARATALRYCEKSVNGINANTSAHLVQNVMAGKGQECHVIHVTKP